MNMEGTVTMPLKDFLTLKQELDYTKQQLEAVKDVTNRQAVVISSDLKFCEVDVYTTLVNGRYDKIGRMSISKVESPRGPERNHFLTFELAT